MTHFENHYDWGFCGICKYFGMCLYTHAGRKCVRCEDAPSVWNDSAAPGGMVCAACGEATEATPCREHQPSAYGMFEGGAA